MKANNGTGLRRILEEQSTAELDELLQEELQKKPQDKAAVKMVLTILEERDAAAPKERTQQSEAARERYHEQMRGLFRPVPKRSWAPALKVASIVLVVCILFVGLPLRAEAETFWERLQRWSSTVMEYFSRQDRFKDPEYIFLTENPGLQQVYDAVVELGVTEPVVPMWLPEECELTMLSQKDTPMLKGVWARFSFGEKGILFKVDVYEGEPAHQYYKDGSHYESYERNGTTYNISRNNERWSAVWTNNNIECHITLDCQEDTLRRILESIYVMEE